MTRRTLLLAYAVLATLATSNVHCGGAEEDPRPAVLPDPEKRDILIPPAPANCDGKRLPTEDPCTIHESYGVFVSASGNDMSDGSRRSPLRTLATGMRIAELSKRRLYICADVFREPLVILNGVSVFGYFNCKESWTIATARDEVARIAPLAYAIAARATDISKPTRIEAVEIIASDGKNGASSLGLVAVRAKGLAFHRTRIVAGRGSAGADGVAPTSLQNDSTVDGEDGLPLDYLLADCDTNCRNTRRRRPRGGINSCQNAPGIVGHPGGDGARAGITRFRTAVAGDLPLCFPLAGGGAGGGGAGPFCYYPEPDEPLDEGLPVVATPLTANGARFGSSRFVGTTLVRDRQLATAGEDGAAGRSAPAGVLGTFGPNGYHGGDGAPGENGSPGQGGGGGTAQVPDGPVLLENMMISHVFAAMGGGGGAGGCPGLGGTGGAGGGASIAVLTIDGSVTFDDTCTLEANVGGIGGAGSFGSPPTAGGSGGSGAVQLPETKGASGGRGGHAGPSGPGASGPSIGVAWTGSRPVMTRATIVLPAAPAPPQPARRENDRVMAPGASGMAAREYAF